MTIPLHGSRFDDHTNEIHTTDVGKYNDTWRFEKRRTDTESYVTNKIQPVCTCRVQFNEHSLDCHVSKTCALLYEKDRTRKIAMSIDKKLGHGFILSTRDAKIDDLHT
jgi:hypothetical protein